MDDYLPQLLLTVLVINLFLFLGQAAVTDLSTTMGTPGGDFYNAQGSLLCRGDKNACANVSNHVLTDNAPSSILPSSESVTASDGSIFTDMFSSVKSWIMDSLGLSYITDILSAPKNFLAVLGLPEAAAWGLAALWYLFSILIIVAFLWGR